MRENATLYGRDHSRTWYAKLKAPVAIFHLFALQKILARLSSHAGPILISPLHALIELALDPERSRHPVLARCFCHYADKAPTENAMADPKSINAWRNGSERPSFYSLGRYFDGREELLEIVLNCGFASLIESIFAATESRFQREELPEMRDLLTRQARCLRRLDERLAAESESVNHLGFEDYERYFAERFHEYHEELNGALGQGDEALEDVRYAEFSVYPEYGERFLMSFAPPPEFSDFLKGFEFLLAASSLDPRPTVRELEQLSKLRRDHPKVSASLKGPLLAVEARLLLIGEPNATKKVLHRVLELYRDAVESSRYCAGSFTREVLAEALGFGAMLHRRGVGEGSIKPWLKHLLRWWDLVGLGHAFDHEQEDQRYERAETQFSNAMSSELRNRLREAMPSLGFEHWDLCGFVRFADFDPLEKKADEIDKRQKKPMTDTVVGRKQTPLMEAIDRDQLDRARELILKGADLNFINSTGDTCLTKAFARNAYDLVLEALRRDENPIRRTTILRNTEKRQVNALEQAISHGQAEILREITQWKQGRGEKIDMNVERLWGLTPLYYAVNCLGKFRRSLKHVDGGMSSLAFEAIQRFVWEDLNPEGLLECINCFATELDADLDAPNTNDHSALTLSAEFGMQDVAAIFLRAGANVNHRVRGGDTALSCAIMNNDTAMAKLLIEYCADSSLFVDRIGQPIHMMRMSEAMRRLIPSQT